MQENTKKKETKSTTKYAWIIFILFVTAAAGATLYVNERQKVNELQNFAVKEKERLFELQEKCMKEKAEAVKAQEELHTLKERLSGIKDNDDLLKRDIELYIRKYYKKVPSIVAQNIAENIVTKSREHDQSPELVVGIIQVESNFNPMAVGTKTKYGHARGLMQVMPSWAKEFKLESKYDLHDIDANIDVGIRVFKFHLHKKDQGNGNISKGLYYYVNQDKKYVSNVYAAMGKFVAFRSTVQEQEDETNGQKGDDQESDAPPKPVTTPNASPTERPEGHPKPQ